MLLVVVEYQLGTPDPLLKSAPLKAMWTNR